MANPFGGFVHASPLSSLRHDPNHELASSCVRDHFGPTVQTVADCLLNRGPSTLPQIVSRIRQECRRDLNEERGRLASSLAGTCGGGGSRPLRINRARGPEGSGFVVDADPIRAALLVLVQHSLVSIEPPSNHHRKSHASSSHPNRHESHNHQHHHRYAFDPDRARLLPRYARYAEYAKSNVDDVAASIIEEVLVHGRLRTEDAVRVSTEAAERRRIAALAAKTEPGDEDTEGNGGGGGDEDGGYAVDESERDVLRLGVVKSLRRLVEEGYLETVPPLDVSSDERHDDNDADTGEAEFDGPTGNEGRKRKRSKSGASDGGSRKRTRGDENHEGENDDEVPGDEPDDPKVVTLIRSKPYDEIFPRGGVWRVNVRMFHDSIRAEALGQLVEERYGDKVAHARDIVKAALQLAAQQEHATRPAVPLSEEEEGRRLEERGIFSPKELVPHLPPAVSRSLESKAGGALSNVSKALVFLTQFTWPQCVMEVEDAQGHPDGGKFEIAVRQLVQHLRGRILHQVVRDHHGEVAARICSILESKGHLESDAIAEGAMVPAKDVREILHRLYRDNYINLLSLQQTKQHNPKNAVYLWTISKPRLLRHVTNNVCMALTNLRLRRQHETEEGRDWIERAKEAGLTDENAHEQDELNKNKFCQGLERLDNALLQLDETLMVLNEF